MPLGHPNLSFQPVVSDYKAHTTKQRHMRRAKDMPHAAPRKSQTGTERGGERERKTERRGEAKEKRERKILFETRER